jgi:cytochrome b pre-mRNA-processing protein 3
MVLLFRRLRSEDEEVKVFSQAVFDLFFKDMDRSLREMGAGDLAVPKKIQKMGSIFYGLLTSLNEAMDHDDAEAVEAVLARNLFDGSTNQSTRQLAAYLFAEAAALDAQPLDDIVSGKVMLGEAA